MIKGLIFDLDGTLLDTVGDLTTAVNRMLRTYDIQPLSQSVVATHLGNGIGALVLGVLPLELKHKAKEATKRFHDIYAECFMVDSKPYEGIMELLTELKQRGIKMAIVSNKAQAYVEQLVKKNFPDIPFLLVLGETGTFGRKPDPAGLIEALRLMGFPSSQVALVGDTEVDKETADNAFLRMIGVSWGFRSAGDLRNAGVEVILDKALDCLNELSRV